MSSCRVGNDRPMAPGGPPAARGSATYAAPLGPRSASFLPVKVLSRLFLRLLLEGSVRLHAAGKLAFFGDLSELADAGTFAAHLAPLRKVDRVVCAKPPFGGPETVPAYLGRYTHRVAISNHRLVSADAGTVAFRWKDYRIERGDPLPGSGLQANHERGMKVMRLPTFEFIRRFPIHVLPPGFHRISHTGFLANGIRRDRIEAIRRLTDAERKPDQTTGEDGSADAHARDPRRTCPRCGSATRVVETFIRGQIPQSRAPPWEDAA